MNHNADGAKKLNGVTTTTTTTAITTNNGDIKGHSNCDDSLQMNGSTR